MNNGSSNASRRGPPPSRPNQFGYNPGHDRGRAYGGYTRGRQRQHHRGYRYGGSRFTASNNRAGSEQTGQSSQYSSNGAQMSGTRQVAMSCGPSQSASQPESPVPEVFKAQKDSKAKVDEGNNLEGKEKPFCFRCYKLGHRKLECTAKLHYDICDSHEHLTSKCPILKQPHLLAHPCGYSISGLGFYHIPHAPYTLVKTSNTRALVTV
jgi:hypothetical protein